MKRSPAKFRISYSMNRTENGTYEGILTIDRPEKNKGYIMLDFKQISVRCTLNKKDLKVKKVSGEHECLDSVLNSIDPKTIYRNQPENPNVMLRKYRGEMTISVKPETWIMNISSINANVRRSYSSYRKRF